MVGRLVICHYPSFYPTTAANALASNSNHVRVFGPYVSMTLDGEKNFRKPGYRRLAIPIALQFTDELNPAGGFTTCLLQPSQASFVRFHRCSRNTIDHGINLKARGDGVEGGM